MIKKIFEKYPIIKEMFFYGVIGGTTALIDTAVYTLLTHVFSVNELISNFVGVNIGIALSFILNTVFNFKKKDYIQKRAISFFSVGYLGLVVSMLILWIGVDMLRFNDIYVKLCSVVIVAVFQFVLNKLITYGKIGNSDKNNEDMS